MKAYDIIKVTAELISGKSTEINFYYFARCFGADGRRHRKHYHILYMKTFIRQ